jgi:hypothetical protein
VALSTSKECANQRCTLNGAGKRGSPALAPPLDRDDSSSPRSHPRYRPRPYRKEIAYLSNPHVDIPPDLGSPIVEDGFEVKSTAGCVIYTCPYGTCRRQEVSTQKIDIPKLGADVCPPPESVSAPLCFPLPFAALPWSATKVRNVGAHRIPGKKTNEHTERTCADSENNFLICHGDQDATSRPEETQTLSPSARSSAA